MSEEEVHTFRSADEWIADLHHISWQAAHLIEEHGWQQETMSGPNGELCIMEAGHQVRGSVPGLSSVLREVLAFLGMSEKWNDEKGRTQDEVVAGLRYLRLSPPVMEAIFGRKWKMILYLASMFGSFGPEELENWRKARDEIRDFQVLRSRDKSMPPTEREQRSRSAVCAAESYRAQELKFKPSGPSVALLVSNLYFPDLDEE